MTDNDNLITNEERQLRAFERELDRDHHISKTIIEPLYAVVGQKVSGLVVETVDTLINDKIIPENRRREFELRFYRSVAYLCAYISWPSFGGEELGGDAWRDTHPNEPVANPLMYAMFGNLK